MKKMSVKFAVLIPVIIVLFLGIAVNVILVGTQASNMANNLTDNVLSEVSMRYANRFELIAAQSYGALTSAVPFVEGMSESGDEREEVIDSFKEIIEQNDSIFAIWTCWEPDAYDGRDAEYADTEYHDSTGRFIPWVYTTSSGVAVDCLLNYDDATLGAFYQGAKSTGDLYITEPYEYEGIYLYTVTIPILRDGAVVGAVGVDVPLENLSVILDNATVLEDGYVFTLTPDRMVATHPDSSLVGKSADDYWLGDYKTQLADIAKNGGAFTGTALSSVTNSKIRFLFQGVKIGGYDEYWTVCIALPESTATAESNQIFLLTLLFGVGIILLVGVALFFIVRTQLKDLPVITDMADTLAAGDVYGVNVESGGDGNAGKNEIAKLKHSFSQMVLSIRAQTEAVKHVADCDLTIDVTPQSDKDALNIALRDMLDSNNRVFSEIMSAADQVSTGSKQIADGAQSLAQGSTQQASAVEQLSASISEIANKTNANANQAREAAGLSGEIMQNAEKGSMQMEQMMTAVREINDASVQIENVIKVIDDIAFQTNILALNAAVEAARAGQHGKGFAVVAEEVRTLAAKSADAAKDTGGLIANSVQKANLGLDIATETSASLKDIVNGINRSAEIVERIALSSDEQAQAIAQVNTGIDQVAQVVQQNSATAEESAAASQQMSGQSAMLEELISQFKLKDSGRASLPYTPQPRPGIPDREAYRQGGGLGKY